MHHPTDRIAPTMAFVIPIVEHSLEQEIAQWVHHEGSILQYECQSKKPAFYPHPLPPSLFPHPLFSVTDR